MSGTPHTKRERYDDRRATRDLAVQLSIRKYHSNLYGFLAGQGPIRPVGLTFTFRERGDWIAIAKGFRADDGERVVCFGSGDDLWAALAGLNSAIGLGKWVRDKYAY